MCCNLVKYSNVQPLTDHILLQAINTSCSKREPQTMMLPALVCFVFAKSTCLEQSAIWVTFFYTSNSHPCSIKGLKQRTATCRHHRWSKHHLYICSATADIHFAHGMWTISICNVKDRRMTPLISMRRAKDKLNRWRCSILHSKKKNVFF